jgi:hypothetical protein
LRSKRGEMKRLKERFYVLGVWIIVSVVLLLLALTILKSDCSWINENDLDYNKIVKCFYLLEETEELYKFILCVRPAGAEAHSEYIATIRKDVDYGTAHAMVTTVLQQIRSKWLTDWKCAPLEAYDFEHNHWTIVMVGAQDITCPSMDRFLYFPAICLTP